MTGFVLQGSHMCVNLTLSAARILKEAMNLLWSLRVSGLSRHEVHKRLERHPTTGAVGIHQRHDTSELGFTLQRETDVSTPADLHRNTA